MVTSYKRKPPAGEPAERHRQHRLGHRPPTEPHAADALRGQHHELAASAADHVKANGGRQPQRQRAAGHRDRLHRRGQRCLGGAGGGEEPRQRRRQGGALGAGAPAEGRVHELDAIGHLFGVLEGERPGRQLEVPFETGGQVDGLADLGERLRGGEQQRRRLRLRDGTGVDVRGQRAPVLCRWLLGEIPVDTGDPRLDRRHARVADQNRLAGADAQLLGGGVGQPDALACHPLERAHVAEKAGPGGELHVRHLAPAWPQHVHADAEHGQYSPPQCRGMVGHDPLDAVVDHVQRGWVHGGSEPSARLRPSL
jgi:hypothetical protein